MFHAGGYAPSMVPTELRPMPLSVAMEHASGWRDEHARERRARTLRRFAPDLYARFPKGATGEELRDRFRDYDRQRLHESLAPPLADPSARNAFLQRIEADHADPDWQVCLPTTNDPSFQPARGSTRLFSRLDVDRPLDVELTRLLDPRGWDECSDLFEDTFEVAEHDGDYDEVETPPESYGKNWEGLLYEFADAGPQAVENILHVRFTVTRSCNPLPEGMQAGRWRTELRGDVPRGVPFDPEERRLPEACWHQMCEHPIDSAEVLYQLYDCLAYRIGSVVLPGTMRLNNGFFRAHSLDNGRTRIACLKRIRFGRVTQWSAGRAFDYGELLNYLAPTLLSLWVGDLEQIVPCCKQRRVRPAESTRGE
jgi:hypothetical protein